MLTTGQINFPIYYEKKMKFMVINITLEMGSCMTKSQKVAPIANNMHFPQRISLYLELHSQVLMAEAREEIYRAKEKKVPNLKLGKNLLYMDRLKHSQSILPKPYIARIILASNYRK